MTPTQFEEQTQSLYRLRSKRNKRRALIKDQDKQLLSLSREQRSLWQERQNQPWEPIAQPYQRGWKRSFVLRNDVAESPVAPLYEGILKRINSQQLSSRRDFKRKRRKYGHKVYVERLQELKTLSLWEWQRAALDEKQAALFELREYHRDRRIEYEYVFTEPWRFQLRVEKNMITQFRKPLSLVESRLKQLSNRLETHDLEHRMRHLERGSSWRRSFSKSFARDRQAKQLFRQTPLHGLLDEAQQST